MLETHFFLQKRRLFASDFESANPEHLTIIEDFGISVVTLQDGRVQLMHTQANAKNLEDGEEGAIFMLEMIELSKLNQQQQDMSLPETPPKMLSFAVSGKQIRLFGGPAQFGKGLENGLSVSGLAVKAEPLNACRTPDENYEGKIVLAMRGDCMFIEKVMALEKAGAKAVVIMDNAKGTATSNTPLFAMSGDGKNDDKVKIPAIFLFNYEANFLSVELEKNPQLFVTLVEATGKLFPNNRTLFSIIQC